MGHPRTLLVSNRLPVSLTQTTSGYSLSPSSGGLATALREVHAQGEGRWIGWVGDSSRLSGHARDEIARELDAARLTHVPLSASEVSLYYDGFSNAVLWPLFHYLLDKVRLDAVNEWRAYKTVNERFANAIAAELRPDDMVNTLDERPSTSPIENLATYGDLARFAALAGLVDRRTAARLQPLGNTGSHIAKRARRLREHLHDVLVAAHSRRQARQSDLDALTTAIQAAHAARTLVASPSPGLANRRWSPTLELEIPLHACSLAIERLLVDEPRKRIRKCGAADCDVYYLDTSKGHRRQWCSMKGCGNREKQRRWRCTTQ